MPGIGSPEQELDIQKSPEAKVSELLREIVHVLLLSTNILIISCIWRCSFRQFSLPYWFHQIASRKAPGKKFDAYSLYLLCRKRGSGSFCFSSLHRMTSHCRVQLAQ